MFPAVPRVEGETKQTPQHWSVYRVYNAGVSSREIIRKLKADGWYEVATQGSLQMKHPTKPGRVTVPHPKKDLPLGTLKSIERQARLKLR